MGWIPIQERPDGGVLMRDEETGEEQIIHRSGLDGGVPPAIARPSMVERQPVPWAEAIDRASRSGTARVHQPAPAGNPTPQPAPARPWWRGTPHEDGGVPIQPLDTVHIDYPGLRDSERAIIEGGARRDAAAQAALPQVTVGEPQFDPTFPADGIIEPPDPMAPPVAGPAMNPGPPGFELPVGVPEFFREAIAPSTAQGQVPAPAAAPGRTGVGGHTGHPAQPPQPSLDQLMVPDGVQPLGLESLTGEPDSPGLRQGLRNAEWQGDIASRAAGVQEQGAYRRSDQLGDMAAQQQQLEAERRGAMHGARERYTRALERVQAMEVDPAHFFTDAGRTMGSVVAVVLGMAGTAVSGDRSHQDNAVAMIQGAIDRDIAAQETNLQHAEWGMEGELNLVEMMQSEFDDREAALSAAHSIMLQQTALEIEGQMANLQGEQARAEAQAMALQLRARAATAQQEAEHRQAETELLRARAAAQQANADRTNRRGGGAGGPGRPGMSTNAVRIRGFADSVSQLEQLADEGDARGGDMYGAGMLETRVPDSVLSLTSPDRMRGRQLVRNAVAQYALAMTGQSATDQQMERLERIIMGAGSEEDVRSGVEIMRSMVAAQMGEPIGSVDDLITQHGGMRR